ncbi:metallophosphoesterase, partial [Virgibacillus sp. DJP39]|uniref:metallophosphoesterase n=1 Tax=Virgibacillus sp. DJP39 TaxID=3409790 RepID=UPI003BB4C292
YSMANKSGKPNMDAAEHVTNSLEEVGIRVLKNESVAMQITESGAQVAEESPDSLYLVGLGASWPNNVNVSQALNDVPDSAARVVILHNPEAFEKLPANTSPVSVAGHTHGGQFNIPFTPEWSYRSLLQKDKAHSYGWMEEYGASGNKLYVNPGIGLSTLPLRINRPPEITVFTLKKQ